MLKRLVVHPFLLAVYPILALFAYNRSQVFVWTAYRSILISLFFTTLFFLLFRLFLRDWHKAGLIVTPILIFVFSYGHIFTYIEDAKILGINIGRHRVLIILVLISLVSVFIWLVRTKRQLIGVSQAINILGFVALIFPLFQLATFEIRASKAASSESGSSVELKALQTNLSMLSVPNGEIRPDIYYIILDTYTRDDTLKTYFQIDNSAFLSSLEDMGFYVARCSQSNYALTQPSLASSLNMDYLDALDNNKVNAPTFINSILRNNATRRVLERLGYKIVVTESGFSPTEWSDADVYLTTNRGVGKAILTGGINPFEAILLKTSMGIFLYEYKPRLSYQIQSFLDTAYTEHRSRILFALEELSEVYKIQGPKFVFTHILIPHSPFIFGQNGEIIGRKHPFTLNDDQEIREPEKYQKGYRDQLLYVNSRILPIIQAIISKSKVLPIIILQGDHGTKAQVSSRNARMTILNAYYFPGNEKNVLYPTITPVNTFREVFNLYFGGNLPLLKDVSYFSQYGDRNKSTIIMPNERPNCETP